MGLKHIIVLQNKIDLIPREKAQVNFREIKKFVQGTPAGKSSETPFYAQLSFCSESSPIIPISAQLKYNIDALCDHLTNYIPLPIRDFTQSPKMVVIRSFDVNTPGSEVKLLSKALVGKSIGKLTTQNLGRSIARWCVRWFTYPRCSQARSGN